MATEKIISRIAEIADELEKEEAVCVFEDLLSKFLDKTANCEDFFKLPSKNFFRIIKKGKTENVETIKRIVSKTNETKGKEAPFILNFLDVENLNVEDCIEIISQLDCPICRKLKLFDRNAKTTQENEIENLKKEISELKEKSKNNYQNEVKLSENPLFKTYKSNNFNNFANFLANNANCMENEFSKLFPFFLATDDKYLPYVKLIIEKGGFDVNTQDPITKKTLLHTATVFNSFNTTDYLLQRGASPVIDMDGTTTLHYVAGNRYNNTVLLQIIAYFDDLKKSSTIKNNKGLTPVEVANVANNASGGSLISNGGFILTVTKVNADPYDQNIHVAKILTKTNETVKSFKAKVKKALPPCGRGEDERDMKIFTNEYLLEDGRELREYINLGIESDINVVYYN